MRTSSAIALLSAVIAPHVAAQTSTSSSATTGSTTAAESPVTGKLGNATVVENNPPGIVYQATLPDTAFAKSAYPDGGNVKGQLTAVASPDGMGVIFRVQFSKLPKTGGPFLYHIHVDPVPSDGNCTATLAHLDPFIRGETPACNSSLPQTCQVGDLSGKYGKIDKDPFEVTYVDQFASTLEGIGAFFGNRSVVVHFANTTRITCASFAQVANGDGGLPASSGCSAESATSSSCSSTGTGVLAPTASSNLTTPALSTGGARPTTTGTASPSPSQAVVSAGTSVRLGSAAGVIAFAAAIMFML
ncbi:superoxide dismutase [Diplogelasinospora grovesii]|uniref:superoxide dismutase n=1 Tax=Diplogelasinospora grovesii TaxID=303347 RepID=A0AAN6N1W7_9PEZI|nr:superoxide dismutase [Diplogelasinospora grovesii]